MQHHEPHQGAAFEGYYSKFRLSSGSDIALVICSVHKASQRPHMISLSYYPHNTSDGSKVFQREIWLDEVQLLSKSRKGVAFEQTFKGGHMTCYEDSTTEYQLENDFFKFSAKTKPITRTPWTDDMDTPEGALIHLPLPLHWHVQSLSTVCEFSLDIAGYDLLAEDRAGTAFVHQEKNWANSFPTGHNWVQARNEKNNSGICLAGGQILGVEAYLIGYRSSVPEHSMTSCPPWAMKIAGLSPFMSASSNWDDRSFEFSVQTWRKKLVLQVRAPKGSFFGLSAPFKDGHRPNALAQSFRASIDVQVYTASWLGSWNLIHEDHFDNGSLEYGASRYPLAGSKMKST